jgi:hypothetical protein
MDVRSTLTWPDSYEFSETHQRRGSAVVNIDRKIENYFGSDSCWRLFGTALPEAPQETASDPRGVKRERAFVVQGRFEMLAVGVLQAASFGSTSKSFLELAMGIARAFIASGSSRTRSTCSRPFSRLASLTSTYSASWKARSKLRAAIPW